MHLQNMLLFYLFFIEFRRVLKLEMVMEKKTFLRIALNQCGYVDAKERVVNVIFTYNFILLRDLIVTASLCKVV